MERTNKSYWVVGKVEYWKNIVGTILGLSNRKIPFINHGKSIGFMSVFENREEALIEAGDKYNIYEIIVEINKE